VFILYAGEFLPRTKQFKGDIFRVDVFVSPFCELESLAFAFIGITYEDSRRHRVQSRSDIKDDHIQSK
jgi:hypothetical protein